MAELSRLSRREQVVAAATDLLEAEGPSGLSMRAVAARVGVSAPALYKHFPDKDAIESAVIAQGFRDVAAAFESAVEGDGADGDDGGGAGGDSLWSIAVAYRAWATAHPHLYRLMTHKALRRDELPPGVEAAAAAPLVRAVGGDPDLARAAWAQAHGLTSLELADRFPPDADIDAAWRAGVGAISARVVPAAGA